MIGTFRLLRNPIKLVDELIHEFVVRHFVTRVVATMKSFGVTHVISESFFHFLLK